MKKSSVDDFLKKISQDEKKRLLFISEWKKIPTNRGIGTA